MIGDIISQEEFQKRYRQDLPSKESKSTLEKVGDFMGLSGLAKGTAISLASPYAQRLTTELLQQQGQIQNVLLQRIKLAREQGDTNAVERLTKALQQNQITKLPNEAILEQAPTNKEVIGSAAQTAINILAAGLPMPKVSTAVGRIAIKTGISSIAGAGLGAAQAYGENKTPEEIAQQAFRSGLTSAAITGLLATGGEVFNTIVSKNSANKLYQQAIKVNKDLIRKDKSPVSFLRDQRVWGSLGKMEGRTEIGIAQTEDVIDNRLASMPDQMVNTQTLLDRAKSLLKTQYGLAYSDAQIDEFINDLPIDTLKNNPQISIQVATTLRKQLDHIIRDVGWKGLASQKPLTTQVQQTMANVLRDTVQTLSNTHQEFAALTQWENASKVIQDTIVTTEQKGLQLGLSRIVQDVIFATAGGYSKGIGGGIAGVAVSEATRNPAVLTGTAQIVNGLSNVISKLPAQDLETLLRLIVSNYAKTATF